MRQARGSVCRRGARCGTGGSRWLIAVLLGLAAVGLLAFPATSSAAECTDTWTGPATGGVWTTPGNWSEGKAPGETTVACIPVGNTVIAGFGSVTGVVQGEGSLQISGGSLTVANSEVVSELSSLTLTSGALRGEGPFVLTESFIWTGGGSMMGSGSTILRPGASGTISSSSARLNLELGRRLINEGSLMFAEGELAMSYTSLIENTGTFTMNSESPSAIREATIFGFLNKGTYRRTSGSGSGTMMVPFNNSGTVEVSSGTLGFVGGGSSTTSSIWDAGPGSEVLLAGSWNVDQATLAGNIRVDGWAGTTGARIEFEEIETVGVHLAVERAQVLFGGGVTTLASLDLTLNPILSVNGTLEVSDRFEWIEGELRGPGHLVLLPEAMGSIAVRYSPYLEDLTFVNEGELLMLEGEIRQWNSTIVNRGTFTVNSQETPAAIRDYVGTNRFVNEGTVQKTSGSGESRIETPFENVSGHTANSSGTLVIEHKIAVPASTATPGHCKTPDPVDCATGNFTETQSDLAVGGRGVGLDLTRTYSAQSAAAGATGIFGHGWSNSFDDSLTSVEGGARVTLTDSSGATTPFTKSGASYQAPGWSRDTLSGSSEAGFALILPDQAVEEFSGSGRLESVTDRNGNETALAYEGSGGLETITDPTGRQITLTYNGSGLVETAEDPMGNLVHYTYESGDLKTVTLPGEASPNWQFGYDGSHRMTSIVDGRGGETTNEYDGSDRVVAQTDPAKRETTFQYAPFHTQITNEASGAVTDEWFNSNNQPLSVTRGFGTASATTDTFGYTSAGLLAKRTDGNGHTTTYGYNSAGDRISERDAEGDETKWTYNKAHQVLTETQPNGEATTITRNAAGDPEQVSRPAPGSKTQTVSYELGPHGEVETMTDPLGHAWAYGYDEYGDLESETDPEGDEHTWTYDEDSRVVAAVSPRGNEEGAEAAEFTTTVERDARGRPIRVTNPLGATTTRAYDADGNVESLTDPNGRTTTFRYDADDERIKVERPDGTIEETGYDGAGQMTSQTDGEGDETAYVRNVLGQPVEIIDPNERTTTQMFDGAGNLTTKEDPEGRITTFDYDKANRLKGISYSAEPSWDVAFKYEAGLLVGMEDGTGESAWEYDQLGRLTHSKDGHGETVSWAYNLGDQPIGLTYPNGKSISRAYDKAGRLESVTDWLGHTTSFEYNRDSAQTATVFPAATSDSDEYASDRADRMSGVIMKKGTETLASLAYARDPAEQIESLVSKGLPGAEEESFSYDDDERLTQAGAADYGYDDANNLTEAPGTTNAFDRASEIEAATGATFAYDKEGERTKETPSSGPPTNFEYDQAGDLTAVKRAEEGETPAVSEALSYDGAGLLVSRTVGLATANLVWDVTEAPEALLSDGKASYLYGPGGTAFEQISSAESPTYLDHDQLGSTRLLTNGSGEGVGTFTYAPYGELNGHTGTAKTALGYAGQYTLGQSGLQYLRARFYDPATAQFISRDPAVDITRQPYFYGGDNPLRFDDRTGQACEETVNIGPFTTTVPNIVDCIGDGLEEIVESPASGPAAGVGCVIAEPCPEVGGLGAGIALVLSGNWLHSRKDPCFDQFGADLTGGLTTIAAGLPGLLLERAAVRAGAEVPMGVRIGNLVPGWLLEGVHAMEDK
jgi:RHS repeat-associated protein